MYFFVIVKTKNKTFAMKKKKQRKKNIEEFDTKKCLKKISKSFKKCKKSCYNPGKVTL